MTDLKPQTPCFETCLIVLKLFRYRLIFISLIVDISETGFARESTKNSLSSVSPTIKDLGG